MEKLEKELIYQIKVMENGIETGTGIEDTDTQNEIGHQTFDEYYIKYNNKYYQVKFYDEIIDKDEYNNIYTEWVEYEEVTKDDYEENTEHITIKNI